MKQGLDNGFYRKRMLTSIDDQATTGRNTMIQRINSLSLGTPFNIAAGTLANPFTTLPLGVLNIYGDVSNLPPIAIRTPDNILNVNNGAILFGTNAGTGLAVTTGTFFLSNTNLSGSLSLHLNNFSMAAGSGSSSVSSASLLFAGATNVSIKNSINGNGSLALANNSAASLILGANTITTAAGGGTHALMAQLVIKPQTITDGGAGALVTNTALIYLESPAVFAVTGGTNYTFWSDAGPNRLDGVTSIGTSAAPLAGSWLVLGAGTTTIAPLTLVSGTNKTTASAGDFEYNGTNLFFTRSGTTRENVLVSVDNAAAPTTSIGVGIVNFYGASATNFLGDPNRWLSVNVLGVVYKIPLYT